MGGAEEWGDQAEEQESGWHDKSVNRCMMVYQRSHDDTSEDKVRTEKEDKFMVNVQKYTKVIKVAHDASVSARRQQDAWHVDSD
mmetsp:Transcript_6635/g.11451  ORF Transcript_6635/g.11451 Transcript_6635/m.11451 type:complete len:84 (+) Transcript_6635:569-820(+)